LGYAYYMELRTNSHNDTNLYGNVDKFSGSDVFGLVVRKWNSNILLVTYRAWVIVLATLAACTISPVVVFAETINFTGGTPNLPASDSIGRFTGVQLYAIKIDPTDDADTVVVTLPIAEQGSPTDGVQVDIYTDNSGSPDTSIGSALLTNSTTATCDAYVSNDISTSITGGNTYWVVVSRAGSPDNTNYYWDCVSSSGSDVSKYNSSGTWNAYGQSFQGSVELSEDVGGGGPPTDTGAPVFGESVISYDAFSTLFTGLVLFVLGLFIVCTVFWLMGLMVFPSIGRLWRNLFRIVKR